MPYLSDKHIRNVTLGITKQFDLILHNGMEELRWNPGDVIGPIIREYYVIKYCTAGKGTILVNDVPYCVKSGQCYVTPPGEVMVEIADEHDPWCHTWITINGIKVGKFLNSIGITAKTPIFTWEENKCFLKLMQNAISTCEDISQSTELRRIAHAYLIFDALSEYHRIHTSHPELNNMTDDYINKSIYYMEMNYSNNIKISDVAAYIGLNRSYFFSIFKQQTHFSPQEYLTRLRMSKACELFSYPHSTVASVANSLNYEPSVFFRHFKRIVGISPSEYKKRVLEKAGGKEY